MLVYKHQLDCNLMALSKMTESSYTDSKHSSAITKTKKPDQSAALTIHEWLHELRLHKYAENLQTLSWKEMLDSTNESLEKLGVSTQGARSKLLKVCAMRSWSCRQRANVKIGIRGREGQSETQELSRALSWLGFL
jgi:hypothetical protein